jgi:hypothetical protein
MGNLNETTIKCEDGDVLSIPNYIKKQVQIITHEYIKDIVENYELYYGNCSKCKKQVFTGLAERIKGNSDV